MRKLIILCMVMVLFIVPNASVSNATDDKGIADGQAIDTIKTAGEKTISFHDLKEKHWAFSSINTAIESGIVDGYPDGTFRPDAIVQRDHFIKMSLVAMGHRLEEGDTYWAEPYIEKAIELHLIEEDEFTQYNVPITREEMASIIVKVTLSNEAALTEPQDMEIMANVYDFSTISDRYKQAAIEAFRFGLITGRKVNTFSPHEHSTRAEAVTVINRYLDSDTRIPYTIPEDKLHIVLEDYTDRRNYFNEGTFIKVYAPAVSVNGGEPVEMEEIIETAVVLQNTIESMEKGYGEISVSRVASTIRAEFYNSAESIYRNNHMYTPEDRMYLNPHYAGVDQINLVINARLSNWGEKKFSLYSIRLSKPDRVDEYNREVIESLFKHLFDSDYTKAMNKYDEILNMVLASTYFEETVTYNNRTALIIKYLDGAFEFFVSELKS